MTASSQDRPMKAPRRSLSQWSGFFHMLARFYQNYATAVRKAAKRKRRRAVDVDAQESLNQTAWALHWSTLGKNKLHDPRRKYGRNTRIASLTDDELERMRGPKGERPHRLSTILRLANSHNVRVEIEAKTYFSKTYTDRLMARPYVARLHSRGLLQVKTLASMGAPNGGPARLRPWHDSGFDTILSFSTWSSRQKKAPSKKAAWPVVDYVRGRAKWSD